MQVKDIGQGVGHVPAFGKPGPYVQILASREEGVKNELIDALGLTVASYARVEISRTTLDDHGEHARIGLSGTREHYERHQQQAECFKKPATHTKSSRGWRSDAHRWRTEHSRADDARFDKREARRQRLPWLPRGAQIHRRREGQGREAVPRSLTWRAKWSSLRLHLTRSVRGRGCAAGRTSGSRARSNEQ